MQQAVDAAVARRLVDAHARDLELTAADDTVADVDPRRPDVPGRGGFERERFDLLPAQHRHERGRSIVDAVRGDLVRNDAGRRA